MKKSPGGKAKPEPKLRLINIIRSPPSSSSSSPPSSSSSSPASVPYRQSGRPDGQAGRTGRVDGEDDA